MEFNLFLKPNDIMNSIVNTQTKSQSTDGNGLGIQLVSCESHDSINPQNHSDQRNPNDHASKNSLLDTLCTNELYEDENE